MNSDPDYFPEQESEDLEHIRSQILLYRSTSLMNDRERARFLGLPEGCRMRENAKILNPERLTCGTNVWIGEGAILDAQGGLEVGDNTQIGLSVMVWSHSTHLQALAGQTGRDKELIKYQSTKIGKNTFIAGPSVIGPGVTIGDEVIISPLSFVERDLPDGAVFSNNRLRRGGDKAIAALTDQVAELRAELEALKAERSR
ncbi:MAG: acyltransferase [Acidimicrobiia bacterium]|nr:acyltransferase [Acidimicrobiia bacterium]MDX2466171.1 acyltransferase [Acidimicrobiia bacterium]